MRKSIDFAVLVARGILGHLYLVVVLVDIGILLEGSSVVAQGVVELALTFCGDCAAIEVGGGDDSA